MEKKKEYPQTKFSADVVKEASDLFDSIYHSEEKGEEKVPRLGRLTIEAGNETWQYDTEEEFFADYRKQSDIISFSKYIFVKDDDNSFNFNYYYGKSVVSMKSSKRSIIQRFFEIFEKNVAISKIPAPPSPPPVKPVIFIGHGQSALWRDLKDHLHEKHGYNIVAYEIGARAGHTIRDILEKMMQVSHFALLVLTGEDETTSGEIRARQNVIHEAGLFQGKLGFNRSILLLEEGTEEFSNIQGIQRIHFHRGNIKETYGEILATLKREFRS